ncbi:hypothetical protein [Acinetobacter haemolyticus]|uniref:hypothetical protein n=1 Tax=Acinetobacter haemolyticus TaxID=29430 RepID=UPI000C2B6ECD|nr:hypothetical protein [Acinetobacter haemolyticus]ATZ66784.1 hypothetical protein BSR56_05055 [Acinetobacter haemolyticus]
MLKKLSLLGFISICINSQVYAGLPEMMKIYKNPSLAPKVAVCKGNTNCNAFTALAKQWHDIPKNYRYHGFDVRLQALQGDGYGLNKGFSLAKDRSNAFQDAGEVIYYDGGSRGKAKEAIFAQGMAVLLYIEDKNGWTYKF